MNTGQFRALPTSELLHPELMSDGMLQRILQERGAELNDEVGHWELRELYDALVLPKPKRELDPNRRTTQRLLERRAEASALGDGKMTTSQMNSPSSVENWDSVRRTSLKRSRAKDIDEESPLTLTRRFEISSNECKMSHHIGIGPITTASNPPGKTKCSIPNEEPLSKKSRPRSPSPINFP